MSGQTDREALLALLDRFGLLPYPGKVDGIVRPENDPDVVLMAKEGGTIGYRGFYAAFEFDEDGKFQQLGIYE